MFPHTSYSLQQQYHLPIPCRRDCSPGNPRCTRAARSGRVISLPPSLAVVHLQSSAPRPHSESPTSCHRPVQGIPSAPTTSWGAALREEGWGKDLFPIFLARLTYISILIAVFLAALLLGPGRGAVQVLPPGGSHSQWRWVGPCPRPGVSPLYKAFM